MEQKTQKRKVLTKKEQDKIVPKTICGGASNNISPIGFGPSKGSGGTILRSDGKYHSESLEELNKKGIYA